MTFIFIIFIIIIKYILRDLLTIRNFIHVNIKYKTLNICNIGFKKIKKNMTGKSFVMNNLYNYKDEAKY